MTHKIPLHAQAIGEQPQKLRLIGPAAFSVELCFFVECAMENCQRFDDVLVHDVDARNFAGLRHELLDGETEWTVAHADTFGQRFAVDLSGPIS